jgi:hypothetical protein
MWHCQQIYEQILKVYLQSASSAPGAVVDEEMPEKSLRLWDPTRQEKDQSFCQMLKPCCVMVTMGSPWVIEVDKAHPNSGAALCKLCDPGQII